MSLATLYNQTIAPTLTKEHGLGNVHATPKLVKIVVNVGIGSNRTTPKMAEIVSKDLARITGQKPILTRAKKAVAAFKLRAGEVIGVAVTLRGNRMYDFLERLTKTSLPRIRDFRGLPMAGFDGHGNYSFGIKEHTVFPEIEHDSVTQFYGFGVTIATTATTDESAEALLRALGLPLKANEQKGK